MEKKVKSFDGARINYDISRNNSSKKFIVFLHGAGGDLTAWKKERSFLHRKGYSTLAIDLRGHGLSDRPDIPESYKLENFARDVYYVIKRESIGRFILAGHCFGGMVTITFHKLYSGLAKAYVLIDTTYKAPRILKVFRHHAFLVHVINILLARENLRNKHFSHVNFDKFVGTGDWNYRRIYSDIMHTSFKSWLYTYENIASFNGADVLKSIKAPVLVIEGAKDSIFNILVAKKIKKLIRKSRLDIVPFGNHVIVINNPYTVEHEIFKFASHILR